MGETKKCKHCQTEIDKKAKVCPNCRKKQGGNGKFIVIGIIAFFIIVGALGNNKDDSTNTDKATTQALAKNKTTEKKSKPTAEPTKAPIEYTAYKVSELMSDLSSNALKAEKKYKKQYVEITGKLSNVDSSGKYIDLVPENDDFVIMGVQCYIKNDEQKDKVVEMSKGDTITLKGKITRIGEVLGYSLDIDEIE